MCVKLKKDLTVFKDEVEYLKHEWRNIVFYMKLPKKYCGSNMSRDQRKDMSKRNLCFWCKLILYLKWQLQTKPGYVGHIESILQVKTIINE